MSVNRSRNSRNSPRPPAREIVGEGVQKMAVPIAATYIGPGKAEEFAELCKTNDVDTIIFDDELSPAQTPQSGKNLRLQNHGPHRADPGNFRPARPHARGQAADRTRAVANICCRASRASGRTCRGSAVPPVCIGGEGESQLEADRRKISERIEKIASELDKVRRQRETQRAGRQRSQWPLASIVGYTNAGKSTLLNRSPARRFWRRINCSPRSTRRRGG